MLLAGCVLLLAAHLLTSRSGAPPASPLVPAASVTDIMHGLVAPRAQRVFEAVAVEATVDGERVRAPGDDREWEQLRADALVLIESANLLHLDGRPVAAAHPDAPVAAAPHLRVRQLQRMIDLDRQRWRGHVQTLADAATWALAAVEARNVWQLHSNAGDLALACERCHLAYRFPGRRVVVAVPE